VTAVVTNCASEQFQFVIFCNVALVPSAEDSAQHPRRTKNTHPKPTETQTHTLDLYLSRYTNIALEQEGKGSRCCLQLKDSGWLIWQMFRLIRAASRERECCALIELAAQIIANGRRAIAAGHDFHCERRS